MKHSFLVMFLFYLVPEMRTLAAQGLPPLSRVAPDQPGCVDSKFFPKISACRIDNCEKKDSDHRDILVGEDYKAEAISVSMDGNSRSVMYECWAGTTPASIVEKAEIALKAAGFDVPYRFAGVEASLTARKDDLWITVEAASRFYTLIEIEAGAPDFESGTDADAIAGMMEHWGRVPLVGVQFLPGKADLAPASATILDEVVKLLKDHPSWRVRVEGHTDNVGSKTANLNLSFFRASAVATWLAANGIKRARLDPKGMGDTRPVAENETEAGRNRNRRIELVRIAGLPEQ